MDTAIERALVETFIKPAKRERWLELLQKSKGRRKLRASLAHFADFNPATIVTLTSNQQHALSISQLLTGLGAPTTCYLISENSDWDAVEMDLQRALQQVVGYGRSLAVCLGRLHTSKEKALGTASS